jgi:hypothetical protein
MLKLKFGSMEKFACNQIMKKDAEPVLLDDLITILVLTRKAFLLQVTES